MFVRKFYSMKIITTKRPAEFEFGAWWNIANLTTFNKTISLLQKATKKDGIGRVLCYGNKEGYTREHQRRIYIVKMGHDKKLWQKLTAQGELIRHQLRSVK